ncbi:MAG: hypothetical protein GX638_02425 [Crenarchaeota archaeon]|nr:hypothetical protein [Thermoproteota archaeon]
MDKRDALAVLFEIKNSCKKGWIVTCITLDCPSSQISQDDSRNYQIKMKCKLDEKSKICLKPLLIKYNLLLREENGFVILFSKAV